MYYDISCKNNAFKRTVSLGVRSINYHYCLINQTKQMQIVYSIQTPVGELLPRNTHFGDN